MTKRILVGKTALSGALCLALVSGANAWEPQRNVEFVVPYSAGGGSDINARMLVEAMRETGQVNRNILVNNRPGGSGAVGNSYTHSKRGDGHTLMTFNGGQMMSMVVNDAAVQLDDLTPLATLSLDTLFVGVPADSEFSDLDSLIESAQQDPGGVTIGGAGRGGEDHLAFAMLNDNLGAEFQYVPFDGTGDVTAALLGGHIDAAIFKLGSRVDQSMINFLVTYAEERLEAPFDEIPTFGELGYGDLSLMIFRGYAGPPDMPSEAVEYWENVFRTASETDKWTQEYVENNGLIPTFMGAEESAEYYRNELERYRTLFQEAGMID
ncbi:Bug family tripartite tricarboxylate transporter substrate binding protein [Halomonas alkalisoli]|uniref:Bug family tripartite tricarboxylate transporter substrate binding protein n=1 Tax=Halomonas alkalisoli TaxID=2907158 RepID=UPI001F479FEC|nr:tripartite tricarboxylate transporter substrate binding protein [Halomonas alkalisoli]MCE9682152.1 tripartite tricarboxylate transporter substrate binding protein [Halomonas alkalisoli]